MAETSVREWLASIGCEHYHALFHGSGYTSVSALQSLDESRLTALGVFDGNHRRAILNKASFGITSDLDNVLGDLDSAIKDLEAFSVPMVVDTTQLPTNPAAPSVAKKPPKAFKPPVPPRKAPESDFDLDSLLSDLNSFNPSDVVAATHPSTSSTPPMSHTPEQPSPHPSPAHHPHPASSMPPSHTTPVHNHTTPTPPYTPAHMSQPPPAQRSPAHMPHGSPGHHPQVVPRSYTEVDRERPQRVSQQEGLNRSYSESRPREADANDTTVVTVPHLGLTGATEQMSAEEVQKRLHLKAEELKSDTNLTEEEREERLKEEKMRIGIEKMKIAHKKRVAIKVFNPDRSNKTVVVEEGMTVNMVCHLLVVKNHFDESPNWVLVEQLGDVSLERELEDHECVVDVYSTWPREHNNVFLFKQNEKKYDLFEDPIKYFPNHLQSSQAATSKQSTLERSEKARKILLQEYFSSTSRVPELEGWLWLKDGYKKSWKQIYCILRASGLYYSLKGKQKTAKHLAILVQFEDYELYHGINFKKLLKARTPYCFAFRPIPRQFVPNPKDIKVLCCEEEATALSWTAGIRLAKYGLQLRDNFHKAKMTQFKLEDLTAPDGAKPKAENRASKLVGLRLEKHMEKVREQYQQQKNEEEERRIFYHSPHIAHQDMGEEQRSSSNTSPSDTPIRTPERTPEHSPHVGPRTAPKPAPKPAPRPAPRTAPGHVNGTEESPSISPTHHQHPPYTQPSPPPPQPVLHTQPTPPPQPVPHTQPAPQHQPPRQPQAPYNPYPPPSQPAPPPRLSPTQNSPQVGEPHMHSNTPRVQHPPPQQQAMNPDQEPLFAFAWYHGSIPRDEAVRRLEAMGSYEGSFLVRDSTTVANSYVLTMFSKGVSKNFQILQVEHPSGVLMFRIDDGPTFSTIDQLLRHYKSESDRLPCRLTDFCPRPPTRMTEC